jgi:hypothetical protein
MRGGRFPRVAWPEGKAAIYRALPLEGAAEPRPYLWFALRRTDAPPGAPANRSTGQLVLPRSGPPSLCASEPLVV